MSILKAWVHECVTPFACVREHVHKCRVGGRGEGMAKILISVSRKGSEPIKALYYIHVSVISYAKCVIY